MIDVLDQEKKTRETLISALNEIVEITPESLIRTNELGTSLDFRGGVEIFRRTLTLFENLRNCNLDNVPLPTLQALSQQATQATQTFQEIQQFDPSGQNSPDSLRDSLINTVADQYHEFFQQISPIVAYSVRKGTDFDSLEREARTSLEEINRLRAEINKQGTDIVSQSQAALAQVQRAAAQVGVAQHAVHFKDEADEHLKQSQYWLLCHWVVGVRHSCLWCFFDLLLPNDRNISNNSAVHSTCDLKTRGFFCSVFCCHLVGENLQGEMAQLCS